MRARAVERRVNPGSNLLPRSPTPSRRTAKGMPAGLQLLARPFAEGLLLRVAYAYEPATLHRRPPPLFPECTDPPRGTPAASPAPQPAG